MVNDNIFFEGGWTPPQMVKPFRLYRLTRSLGYSKRHDRLFLSSVPLHLLRQRENEENNAVCSYEYNLFTCTFLSLTDECE